MTAAAIPDPDAVVRWKAAVAASRARIVALESRERAGTLDDDGRAELARLRRFIARTLLSWLEDDGDA